MKTSELTTMTHTTQNSTAELTSVLWNDQVYRELADQPIAISDPFQELEMNLKTLQDLQLRLSFLGREIRYIVKL